MPNIMTRKHLYSCDYRKIPYPETLTDPVKFQGCTTLYVADTRYNERVTPPSLAPLADLMK